MTGISILIVDCRPMRRHRLARRLTQDPGIRVLGPVSDLSEAYNLAEHEVPDVVLLSVELARRAAETIFGDMLAALGIICLVIDPGDGTTGADLPSASAVVPVPVPDTLDADGLRACLDARHRAAEDARPRRRPGLRGGVPGANARPAPVAAPPGGFDPERLILIGSSTGGVDALITVLSGFPTDCPPVLIVQHTGARFARSLVGLLDRRCPPRVRAAEDGLRPDPGTVTLAPGQALHLGLSERGETRCRLLDAPPVSGHRPSVDMLFRSAVPRAAQVVAAILTGMGRDGAAGLLELRRAGATTLAQDQDTSVVYGMPRVAWEIGAAERRLPLPEIGPALLSACRTRSRSTA